MTVSPPARPRRVLVTGADGFVGRAVMHRLRSEGLDPVALPGMLADIDTFGRPVDAVIHLAAVSRPASFAGRPDAWETNVAGTLAVANFCRRLGVGMLFASTSGVYARPDAPEPLSETAPLAPASDYAASKLVAEQVLARHCRDVGLACLVFRIFNPYGPGQDASFAVPSVVRAIQAGQTVRLAQPDAVRDFVAVDDVAQAFVQGLSVLTPGACPIVNVGSGSGVSIRELATMAQRVLGRKAAVEVDPAGAGLGGCVVADIALAERLFGWRPRTGLLDGLEHMAVCQAGRPPVSERAK
ncbi:NAD-dependent 4,6-dehydratase LegB [Fundidesulfovibrio butyratiphilus]